MPRFSANLGFLFSDRPEIERVAAAASCGFKAVEMHWPYQVSAYGVREALASHDLTMLGLNMPVGNAAGDFGLAALPGRAEPEEGEVNYREIFRTLDSLGYQGWVGAEYRPRGRTEDWVGWLSALSEKR